MYDLRPDPSLESLAQRAGVPRSRSSANVRVRARRVRGSIRTPVEKMRPRPVHMIARDGDSGMQRRQRRLIATPRSEQGVSARVLSPPPHAAVRSLGEAALSRVVVFGRWSKSARSNGQQELPLLQPAPRDPRVAGTALPTSEPPLLPPRATVASGPTTFVGRQCCAVASRREPSAERR